MAIHSPNPEGAGFDTLEATYVHPCHRLPAVLASGKWRCPEDGTGMVGDPVLVEAIGAHVRFRHRQLQPIAAQNHIGQPLGRPCEHLHSITAPISPSISKAIRPQRQPPCHAVIRRIRASGWFDYRMNAALPHVYPVDPSPEPGRTRDFDHDQGGRWQATVREASFGDAMQALRQARRSRGAASGTRKP
ncbi:MAG: hypothetical protein KGJ94_02285 [Xanthomonadaceae bacterium]|nr:hypothetical protein [Xanthomonadaceae bacterium]